MSGSEQAGYEDQWLDLRDRKSPDAPDLWELPSYRDPSENDDADYEEDQLFRVTQTFEGTDQTCEGDDQDLQDVNADVRHPGDEKYWATALFSGEAYSPSEALSKLPQLFFKTYNE